MYSAEAARGYVSILSAIFIECGVVLSEVSRRFPDDNNGTFCVPFMVSEAAMLVLSYCDCTT